MPTNTDRLSRAELAILSTSRPATYTGELAKRAAAEIRALRAELAERERERDLLERERDTLAIELETLRWGETATPSEEAA